MRRLGGEGGFALVAAIVVLAVIDAVLAGLAFSALQDQRLGGASVRQLQAFATAEAAALEPVTVRDPAGYRDLTIGGTVQARGGTATGWYRSQVRRLSSVLYLSQADGFSWDWSARQRVAVVLRLQPVPVDVVAPLKTLAPPPPPALTEVGGADVVPDGWIGCPPPGPSLPGVYLPELSAPGGCGLRCLFGDLPFDSLRSFATKMVRPGGRPVVIAPSRTFESCNTDDPYNWGDPRDSEGGCGHYFPAVWSESDLALDGIRGQGVLMVNGDLTLGGGVEFQGTVLVNGTLKTSGAGGQITGAVIARAVSFGRAGLLGGPVVQYSRCAVSRALTQSAALAPLAERGWAELY
jgi:hypothetical protein